MTGRKGAGRDLRELRSTVEESERRFRELFDRSPLPLWEEDWSGAKAEIEAMRRAGVTDVRSHLQQYPEAVGHCLSRVGLLSTNQASLDLFEADSKAQILENLDTLISKESWYVIADLLASLSEGQTRFRGEEFLNTCGGHKRHVMFDFVVMPGHEQSWKYCLVGLTDTTERKQVEDQLKTRTEELASANEALERSNRELERFAYVVSHDLKEPLRAIAGYSQLLRRHSQGKLDELANHDVTTIVDSAARMDRLINDLLEYSRVKKEEKPPLPTDMTEAFDLAMKNLQAAVEQSGAVVTHGELPTVSVNRLPMVSLLQNLIGNAIEYGGDTAPVVHVSADQQDDNWLFSVRDNGIGIDHKHLESVFKVFRTLQAKDKGSGTGIGLAICKKIVEVHGGRIWAESELGRGSVFYFTIPRE